MVQVRPLCIIEGCKRPHAARGFCGRHYMSWKRATPSSQRAPRTTEQRFEAKVDRGDGPDACWIWTGARNSNGYGQFWWGKKLGVAHRYSYEVNVGPIPEGLSLDHLCRTPACVNPAHLEPVTHRENCRRGMSPAAVAAQQNECKNGHPFTPENTRLQTRRDGRKCRHCRTCAKDYKAAQRIAVVI